MTKLLRVGLALVLAVTIPKLSLAYQGESDKKSSKQSKGALPPYNGPKKRLAIVDIEVKSTAASDTGANANPATTNGVGTGSATATASASGDLGSGLTEMLATSLVDSKRFILLERKAMADITAEQQLSTGAGFDPTAANKPGQLLGAQFLIRGAVDEFGSSHSNNAANGVLQNFGINQDKAETFIKLDLRIYEVATGVMLDSVQGEGRVRASATGLNMNIKGINLGSGNSQNSPLAEAARRAIQDAVKKICLRLDKIPWEGHVADIDANADGAKYLYIGVGSASGLSVGQHFSIYHPGRTIVDPDTRVVIGRTKDTFLGHGVLQSCTEKLGTIAVTDGNGYQVGDIVRWDDDQTAPAPGTKS